MCGLSFSIIYLDGLVILYICNFIYLAVLGLQRFKGFSLVAVGRGCSGVAIHRLLIVVASLVVEHWLNSCGARD